MLSHTFFTEMIYIWTKQKITGLDRRQYMGSLLVQNVERYKNVQVVNVALNEKG